MEGRPRNSSDPFNPFATKAVRPGAIDYIFPPGIDGEVIVGEVIDGEVLVARLAQSEWIGQIVGKHGSGKSTLLSSLLPLFEREERETLLVSLRVGQRGFPWELSSWRGWNARTLVVCDGFEQLSCLERRRLKRRCRTMGSGLLVTTHVDAGLPEIYHVEPTIETVLKVVARLVSGKDGVVSTEEVARAWAEHPGDVRETLFSLYDVYERRRP